jgi:hypothetical protein
MNERVKSIIAPVVQCGQSDPAWREHEGLAQRWCLLTAGHKGVHVAHEYKRLEEQ